MIIWRYKGPYNWAGWRDIMSDKQKAAHPYKDRDECWDLLMGSKAKKAIEDMHREAVKILAQIKRLEDSPDDQ